MNKVKLLPKRNTYGPKDKRGDKRPEVIEAMPESRPKLDLRKLRMDPDGIMRIHQDEDVPPWAEQAQARPARLRPIVQAIADDPNGDDEERL